MLKELSKCCKPEQWTQIWERLSSSGTNMSVLWNGQNLGTFTHLFGRVSAPIVMPLFMLQSATHVLFGLSTKITMNCNLRARKKCWQEFISMYWRLEANGIFIEETKTIKKNRENYRNNIKHFFQFPLQKCNWTSGVLFRFLWIWKIFQNTQ